MPSFKVEVQTDRAKRYIDNGVRFATKPEAREYAADLFCRWTMVLDWRVVASKDAVNSIWDPAARNTRSTAR